MGLSQWTGLFCPSCLLRPGVFLLDFWIQSRKVSQNIVTRGVWRTSIRRIHWKLFCLWRVHKKITVDYNKRIQNWSTFLRKIDNSKLSFYQCSGEIYPGTLYVRLWVIESDFLYFRDGRNYLYDTIKKKRNLVKGTVKRGVLK